MTAAHSHTHSVATNLTLFLKDCCTLPLVRRVAVVLIKSRTKLWCKNQWKNLMLSLAGIVWSNNVCYRWVKCAHISNSASWNVRTMFNVYNHAIACARAHSRQMTFPLIFQRCLRGLIVRFASRFCPIAVVACREFQNDVKHIVHNFMRKRFANANQPIANRSTTMTTTHPSK